MSIFTDNIAPALPSNLSWNKIGYIEWEKYLQEKFHEHIRNLWSTAALIPDPSLFPKDSPSYSKKFFKRKFSNKKKLSKIDESELNEVLERIYKNYGVWVKYKVQLDNNKRIKSIVFYRFC